MKRSGMLDTCSLLRVLLFSAFLVGDSAGFAHPERIGIQFLRRRSSGENTMHVHAQHQPSSSRFTSIGGNNGMPVANLHLLRGGAGASGAMLTLPGPSSLVAANFYVALLALKGASLLLSPLLFSKRLDQLKIEKNSLETYLLQGIGAVSIGMSVNIYLCVVGKMQVQRAMGFGLLSRFLYVLQSSLIAKTLEKAGGSNKFLSTNEIVMGWTAFSLLTGAGNPIVSAKVFSCMALFKGVFLMVKPVAASNKFLGIDVSENGMKTSRALARALGIELTTSALLMGALVFGMDPTKALGCTCLWGVFDIAFREKTFPLVAGESNQLRTLVVRLVINALFAAMFLLL